MVRDPEQPDDLTPKVQKRAGPPPEVVAAREALADRSDALAAAVQPNLEAHLLTYRAALDALEDWHRAWIDQTDLDPTGDNRLAAV